MANYRDESDFDWDYRTEPSSDDEYVVPYQEQREQELMRHTKSSVLLARMREGLIQANGVIKQATEGSNQITEAVNVQQILSELTDTERAAALRLANAIGSNAFEYFFTALHQLDQLIMTVYQSEQQLELAVYRPGGGDGLGDSVEMKECHSSEMKTAK